MTEPTSGEQDPSRQQAPQDENWKARFDGQVRKIETMTLELRDVRTQLAAKTSEIEHLKAQLGTKDVEKTAAITERDKQIQEYVQAKAQLEKEAAALKAFKMKVEAAKGLNKPALLRIIDNIPDMTDPEALKTVLKDFADFADEAALEREKQLMAGTTPALSSQPTQTNLPNSAGEWDRYINSLPAGSPERTKAFDAYWNWGLSQK